MNRSRRSAPATNAFDEVIDLTIDSPVSNSLGPRALDTYARRPRRNRTRNRSQDSSRIMDDLLLLANGRRDMLAAQNDSSVLVIDPDEPLSIIHPTDNDEGSEDTANSDDSIEEYSTAIPCVRESIGAELTPLCCPICFESLTAKQKPTTTKCGHIFCAECLKQSLQISRNKSCPICNAPVKIKSCVRLHFL